MKAKKRVHGIMSLVIFEIAITIAIYKIAVSNIIFAGLYFLIILLGFGVVIYSFCTKCSANKKCSHFFIGPIAQIMPKRKIGNYNVIDYLGAIVPITIILGFPQYWLLQSSYLFLIFWILIIITGIQINFFVCSQCSNNACAMCKKKLLIEKLP